MDDPNNHKFDGDQYDTPIIIQEPADIEPKRYLINEPYELTEVEFVHLEKNYLGSSLSNWLGGATAGHTILAAGKYIANSPVHCWEWYTCIIGAVATFICHFCVRGKDDKKKHKVHKLISEHFDTQQRRRLHITPEGK